MLLVHHLFGDRSVLAKKVRVPITSFATPLALSTQS